MHKDILGNEIKEGDSVVYPHHNSMKVGLVAKLNPKMVNIIAIGRSYADRKYPNEVLVVDDPKITMYILKNSK
tara:strand:- start:2162 stop:2380 length:219 start_codon:yes stop_codon:yes gene_type:complete